MDSVIKKIRLEEDELGKPYIYIAWNEQEEQVITPESVLRPEVVVENGMITQILKNGLDIEIPEFKPFSEKLTLYFLNQKQTESFNKPLAKDLASKLIKKLMNDGKLKSDYKTKLEIIENELNDFGDNLLKDYVLNRINKVIEIYQKTGVWDFLLLGK